jgi:hypothetical protein
VGARRADRFDHAEGIGWVAEVRQVADQDRCIGRGELRLEPRNGLESHVNVAEAHEPHAGLLSRESH